MPRIAAFRRLRTINREITTHPNETTTSITHATVSTGSARNSSILSPRFASSITYMGVQGIPSNALGEAGP